MSSCCLRLAKSPLPQNERPPGHPGDQEQDGLFPRRVGIQPALDILDVQATKAIPAYGVVADGNTVAGYRAVRPKASRRRRYELRDGGWGLGAESHERGCGPRLSWAPVIMLAPPSIRGAGPIPGSRGRDGIGARFCRDLYRCRCRIHVADDLNLTIFPAFNGNPYRADHPDRGCE